MVNGSENPAGNGDDSLFLAAPLLKRLLLPLNFGILLATAGRKGGLNKQGFKVSAGFANTGGFLLARALRVLRGKTSPGTKVLGSIEYRHISTDLGEDANGGKGVMDAGDSQQQFDPWKMILSFSACSWV